MRSLPFVTEVMLITQMWMRALHAAHVIAARAQGWLPPCAAGTCPSMGHRNNLNDPPFNGLLLVTGYGGGMSSAKAALESDTRVLAYEAGRKWGVRVNTISAGPLGSRAAKAIGFIDDMIRCVPS